MDLHDRLKLRKQKAPASKTPEVSPQLIAEARELGFRFTPEGFFLRHISIPRQGIVGQLQRAITALSRAEFGTQQIPASARSGRPALCFYDTETTGLSSGAGTVCFLVGWAEPGDDGIELTQVLLPDLGFERAMLEWSATRLSSAELLFSYNGRSFDRQILQTRFSMTGIRAVLPPEYDLLYPTRRLFAHRIGSCRLGNVEQHILRIERELDIPGAEAPERYFAWLRGAGPQEMRGLIAHHEQDIVSLVDLLLFLGSVFDARLGQQPVMSVDGYGLGRSLLLHSTREAREILEATLLAPSSGRDHRRRSALLLAASYRKEGRYQRQAAVLHYAWRVTADSEVAEALSSCLEHRLRNLRMALTIAGAGLESLLTPGTQPAWARQARGARRIASLEHRIERLRRKLGML